MLLYSVYRKLKVNKRMIKSDEVICFEKAMQALTSATWNIHESFSYLHDQESINILTAAIPLLNSVANKTSDQMNQQLLKEENDFKNKVQCQKIVRCFICGERECGECGK